jgi:hypothetical protein
MMWILALIGFIVAWLAFVPVITIWAVNVLFGLGIAYTLKTWAAALVLIIVFASSSTRAAAPKK